MAKIHAVHRLVEFSSRRSASLFNKATAGMFARSASAEQPEPVFYTESHQWIQVDQKKNGLVKLGFTEHGLNKLGDVSYIDAVAELEKDIGWGDKLMTLEGENGELDMKMPISGSIQKFNSDITEQPDLFNREPECYQHHLAEVKASNLEKQLENLMTKDEYEEYIVNLERPKIT